MILQPKRFLLGPFIVANDPTEPSPAGVQPTGLAIEFSTPEDRYKVPIHVKTQRHQVEPSLDDYCVGEQTALPVDVTYFRAIQSVETDAGVYISFGRVLGALYEDFAPSTDLLEILEAVSKELPFTCISLREPPTWGVLTPQLEDIGFNVNHLFSYGDSIMVDLCWLPNQSKASQRWHQNVPSGVLNFRPRHDQTLGRGTFAKCWECSLPFHLFEILKQKGGAHPIDYLTDEGKNSCLSAFEWQPKHRISKAELAEQRIQLVENNRGLWGNPKALSILLKEEGLYSDSTSISQISKAVATMLAKLDQSS